MKFIHTADLHIDSPLRGLEAYDGAPLDRLRNATRQAFENVVALAINERVDFVVIAGDLFDGKWPDMKTGIWTSRQFRRLERERIRVFLLRGNHDAASQVRQMVTWPDGVQEFPVEAPYTFRLDDLGVALHGQGFPRPQVSEDLAAAYPPAIRGLFNIGVLHTSLTGDPNHDTYAPTTEDALVAKGYDYWALGHIHAHRVIREEPFIAFSGCTQGRHVNEPGQKGCLLVTVEGGQVVDASFRATDTLRWHHAEIDLHKDDDLDHLYSAVSHHLTECHDASDGRFAAVRVTLRGACAAHRTLMTAAGREQAVAEIRNLASTFHDELWVEKILFDTLPPVDLEELRQAGDLMGDLLRMIERVEDRDTDLLELAGAFSQLSDKAALELAQSGIDLHSPEQLRRWLRQAEGLLVSQLWAS